MPEKLKAIEEKVEREKRLHIQTLLEARSSQRSYQKYYIGLKKLPDEGCEEKWREATMKLEEKLWRKL